MAYESETAVETSGMRNLSVKLPADAYEHVERRSWATFSTMSEYVRQLVFEDMAKVSGPDRAA